jgi:hypothetical protein
MQRPNQLRRTGASLAKPRQRLFHSFSAAKDLPDSAAARNVPRSTRLGEDMSRLVRKPRLPDLDMDIAALEGVLQSGIAGVPMANAEHADNYLDRMVKYVPAEIIAGFMLINSILDQAMKSGGPSATMAGFPVSGIAVVALLCGMALVPLFCWYVREEGDAWVTHALVATVAFPFWAYLLGAVAFADHHDGNLAVILVLTFTAVSGLVAPQARRPKAARDRRESALKDAPRRLVESLTG